MIHERKNTFDRRPLPDTDIVSRKGALNVSGWLLAALILASFTWGGCQSPLPPLPNPPGPYTPVRLSPGDVIKLSFAEETDLDQVQRIRRDGKVSLPLIGEVTAAGKRVIDFQRQLVSLYEPHLDNPDLVVTLDTGATNVIVSGFANKPGKYTFDRPTTVYQAIMEAGGVSDYGSASNVRLTRIINGVQRAETINLRQSIHGTPVYPEYVQDGDVIYIARSLF
jgi:protein involved in polysaccharide export with SLBB domain